MNALLLSLAVGFAPDADLPRTARHVADAATNRVVVRAGVGTRVVVRPGAGVVVGPGFHRANFSTFNTRFVGSYGGYGVGAAFIPQFTCPTVAVASVAYAPAAVAVQPAVVAAPAVVAQPAVVAAPAVVSYAAVPLVQVVPLAVQTYAVPYATGFISPFYTAGTGFYGHAGFAGGFHNNVVVRGGFGRNVVRVR